jgi:hypothetical protein
MSSAVQGNPYSNICISFISRSVVWCIDIDVSNEPAALENLIDFSLIQIIGFSFLKILTWIEVWKIETIQEHGACCVL